jgi:uncharacterized protein with ParB-like and HNH nuclease domain
MAATISVNKQNVQDLLKTGRTKPFVIPEYQRPYAWTDEQIETLFEDIWEFATTIGGLKRNGSYFLGSIVSFENENGEQEIIDGQQRITSLFLLLRAIYTKLVQGDDSNTEAAQNFIKQIEPAIWRTDNLTGKVDFSDILLTSKVVDNDGNMILRDILRTGMANSKANDNYSKNYLLFQKLYDTHCAESPLQIYDFIYAILNQAILLPIGADTQDTALTIFSTLNNRGLQLTDADIFKAKIYNHLKEKEEKDAFIAKWKRLEREASEANESIQRLFYYYMFFLRACDGNVDSTVQGVRKYFLAGKGERLYEDSLMEKLNKVLNFWKVINTNHDIPEEIWDNNAEVRKALDILVSYPNEYWKYPVITYYLSHCDDSDFEKEFLLFLNKLIGELISRFIIYPTINFVKGDILKLNVEIINNPHPKFAFRTIDTTFIGDRIKNPHRNIVRMLLKIFAYNHQRELLPPEWQIEHILPRKWQSSFFPDTDDVYVNDMVEHIGNKTPFEKVLNIVASNGYFAKKQAEYKKSSVEVTKVLVASISEDWTIGNIQHRDDIISEEITELLSEWNDNYERAVIVTNSSTPLPTPEEEEMIKKLKAKGLI